MCCNIFHGLDLSYRVDPSNNIVCYHADAQANIIAVTDSGGTTVAQYAYTPYGRSLGSTNLQSNTSNPYLFVGSQGVMEELPGLYFMRARYYSADAGVFLSTDPVKKIGPGWKAVAYGYANGNPLSYRDPNGLLSQEQADRIMRYQQEALQYELKAIWWNALADSLQGVYDALQTTESLLTGDVVGVGTGLTKQLSTLAHVSGKDDLSASLSTSADMVNLGGAVYDVGKIANNASKLTAHYSSIDGNWARISAYSSQGRVGGMYGEVLKPLVSNGFNGIGQTVNAVVNHGASSSGGGGGSSGNQSMSGRTPGAGSYAQGLNSVQASSAASSTSSVSNSGSSGGGSTAFTRVVNSVEQAATSVTQAVRNAATTVAQAVSSAVSSVVSTVTSWFRRP